MLPSSYRVSSPSSPPFKSSITSHHPFPLPSHPIPSRRYVKSRSDSQLSGTNVSGPTLTSSCQPEDYLAGNTSMPINPCGLVAWSLFNDTFSVSSQGVPVAINESGIAWQSDIDTKFGSQLPQNFNTIVGYRVGGTLPPNQAVRGECPAAM